MAYKVFVAGQEALAADVNTHLMSQTVSRFTNAATRSAELAGPALNQLSITNDRPGQVQYWNGSAWADLVPRDPILHQWGTTVGTTNGFGWLTIPFPTAFADVSYRLVATNGDADSVGGVYSFWVGVLAGGKFTNSVVVGASYGASGGAAAVANTNIRVDWIAIGTRP